MDGWSRVATGCVAGAAVATVAGPWALAYLGFTKAGVVAGSLGHMLGRHLGILNKVAGVMFAGLAVRLVAK